MSEPGGSSKFFRRIARNKFIRIMLPITKSETKYTNTKVVYWDLECWCIIEFQSSPMKMIKIVTNPVKKALKFSLGKYSPSADA